MFKRIFRKKTKVKTTSSDQEIKEKRAKLAEAASRRQNNWRQQSSSITSKDRIIATIKADYQAKGKEAPIGLYSSSLPVLKKHLVYIKKKT
jgi:hypothetical protein